MKSDLFFDSETRSQANLTYAEKNHALYLRQKNTLDLFLARGAISPAQYRKSLGDLTEKMGEGKAQG